MHSILIFVILQGKIAEILVVLFKTLISQVFFKLFEVCQCLKYSSWTQLSDGTKNIGPRITLCDPTVILRQSI